MIASISPYFMNLSHLLEVLPSRSRAGGGTSDVRMLPLPLSPCPDRRTFGIDTVVHLDELLGTLSVSIVRLVRGLK
jgi:hypothetical protein